MAILKLVDHRGNPVLVSSEEFSQADISPGQWNDETTGGATVGRETVTIRTKSGGVVCIPCKDVADAVSLMSGLESRLGVITPVAPVKE